MIAFEHDIVINRPPEAVFAFLTDVSRYPQWQTDLAEYRQTLDGPLSVGSTGIAVRNIMGQRDESGWQVTELAPNSAYTVKTSGTMSGELANTLQPAVDGTQVHVRVHLESKGLLRVAEQVMAGFVKKAFTDGYLKMKEMLEAR
jgi:carbon monoxide dehydrogenase subunit G